MSETLKEVVGKTLKRVEGLEKDSDCVTFHFSDGSVYRMDHTQDCCEDVWLEDIDGDESDIIGGKILEFTERNNVDHPPTGDDLDSFTWTFYHIQSTKGHVVLRWFGTSNGYYSEEVDFYRVR